jgi:hypothetical protein
VLRLSRNSIHGSELEFSVAAQPASRLMTKFDFLVFINKLSRMPPLYVVHFVADSSPQAYNIICATRVPAKEGAIDLRIDRFFSF